MHSLSPLGFEYAIPGVNHSLVKAPGKVSRSPYKEHMCALWDEPIAEDVTPRTEEEIVEEVIGRNKCFGHGAPPISSIKKKSLCRENIELKQKMKSMEDKLESLIAWLN